MFDKYNSKAKAVPHAKTIGIKFNATSFIPLWLMLSPRGIDMRLYYSITAVYGNRSAVNDSIGMFIDR